MRRTAAVVLGCALALSVVACAEVPADADPVPHVDGAQGAQAPGDDASLAGAPAPAKQVVLPPVRGTFDYQLGGAYDAVPGGEGDGGDGGDGTPTIDVVVRDATADPLPGAYNVCYVNGFQTQPDAAGLWTDEHPDLLLRDADGELVVDPDWPDEYVLDPSTEPQRDGILAVIGPVVTGCADAGFDAVEIDNLDTWTRFDQIDDAGAYALASAYVDLAHAQGLAIAQKNAAEIAPVAHRELGFDFAVTEECGAWSECADYTDVYGDHVLQVEYPDALDEAGLTFDDVCALDDRAPLTVLRDLDLVAPDAEGYVYEACAG
ncbi:endo alpha-1,4 polygalactosaminidase [Isoptericola sp. NEAU-Y5]|uniref:Endo alpha-1,4 polygalactosaminidase n=1 Tax=Isoptericola luteus TaxID=2879484 RepID=A0ABS7Z9K5_9MICO|nr:endo alpha-1,4 polygalactosaminidase [Isoptericola sp. NEAU-Y5]MCA5891736.1 endo alpha-1,4 polygalactosaminidase [Isoptericola sp. NEAU-Y5]MCA5894569.1 endo alpha-1,4 polygalactosaminidase [Isoptericola sp. NEAU-Y5]